MKAQQGCVIVAVLLIAALISFPKMPKVRLSSCVSFFPVLGLNTSKMNLISHGELTP